MNPPRICQSQARAAETALAAVAHEVFASRRPADRVLAEYMRHHRELGARDRRFVSETLYSLFRWWGWISKVAPDCFIQRLATQSLTPKAAGESLVRQRLLLAAAVAERTAGPALISLLARRGEVQPNLVASIFRIEDTFERTRAVCRELGASATLEISELLPSWALDRFPQDSDINRLLLSYQQRPPLWLRIQKGDPEAVIRELRGSSLAVQRSNVIPFAVMVSEGCSGLYLMSAYREGRVEIQDIASQAVGLVCAPRPGERWWDACAGGGGKTLLLAQLMKGRGTVVASDIRGRKLMETRRRAARAGFSNIPIRSWNGSNQPSWARAFDGVLVDAPCSGSGTWRRNPAARWTVREEDLEELSAIQIKLLSSAGRAVKPGGALVYATCSLFEIENQGTVRRFLDSHPHFVPEQFVQPFTGNRCVEGWTYFWPWEADCDGMFVARFRRTE